MGIVRQLTVLLENKAGELSRVCSELALKDINILAICVQDSIDLCLTRMVVSDTGKAKRMFEEEDFRTMETDVLSVELTDKPGGLAEIARHLHKEHINIEYMYASVSPENGKSIGIFWVSNLNKAVEILEC